MTFNSQHKICTVAWIPTTA